MTEKGNYTTAQIICMLVWYHSVWACMKNKTNAIQAVLGCYSHNNYMVLCVYNLFCYFWFIFVILTLFCHVLAAALQEVALYPVAG